MSSLWIQPRPPRSLAQTTNVYVETSTLLHRHCFLNTNISKVSLEKSTIEYVNYATKAPLHTRRQRISLCIGNIFVSNLPWL